MFPQTVGASYLALCSSIDTPRSLACSLLFKTGEHVQLLSLNTNALDYEEDQQQKFRNDYLVTEYLKKYPGLETGIDTEAVARLGFTAAESACSFANKRIAAYETIVGENRHLARIITYAQALIESCIRSSPDFAEMSTSSKWGKGSTFSLKGEEVRIDAKVCEDQISVTEQALPFVRAAMAEDFALLRARGIQADGPTSLVGSEFNIVHGSRGTVVPKNAKTGRFIAIEPSGNVFIQLGYGALLRQCLRRAGIDLNDQGHNQLLASLALVEGLATVDLSSASDTICRELVWLLLPFRWAYALDSARSHMILIDGKWILLEKFSSMGNGFTFELETLIFWALTKAVCAAGMHSGRISVYGDDIICPSSAFRTLKNVMDFCGFTVNTKKTHTNSLFRESCGEHYFNGQNVTPIYQKETLGTLEAYYRFHNRWVYHASDRGTVDRDTLYCDKTLWDVVKIAGFNRLDNPHLLPLQSDRELRTLDGGLVVDARRIKNLRFSGMFYTVRAWVFIPDALPAWNDAMYAVRMRLQQHGDKAKLPRHYLGYPIHTRESVSRLGEVKKLARNPAVKTVLQVCNYKAIGRELGVAFTGTLTLRDRGRWSSGRRHFLQACNMCWV